MRTGISRLLKRCGESLSRIKPVCLLVAAACLHIAVVATINLAGRYRLMPRTFNAHGLGISFAIDSEEYRIFALRLVKVLSEEGVSSWLANNSPFHIKLYSLCFYILGPLAGETTLSLEPLNLFYYLLILTLVFRLGREVFDRRTGLIAATIVALWPSFLLHTTQLLRDPLFIAMMLALVLVNVTWLTRVHSIRGALVAGALGGVAAALVWLIRSDMWEVMLAVTLLSICLMGARMFFEKRLYVGNAAGALLLLLVLFLIPKLIERPRLPVNYESPVAMERARLGQKTQATGPVARLIGLRKRFSLMYPEAGSNIDTDVQFNGVSDIALYLPRAVTVGLFAPFPRMWFAAGTQVGRAGRLLSGFETLLMYVLEALAVICLWLERRRPSVWLLFLTALMGVTALSLVVVNISALYRMRYVFWMLLIVLGVQGLMQWSVVNGRWSVKSKSE